MLAHYNELEIIVFVFFFQMKVYFKCNYGVHINKYLVYFKTILKNMIINMMTLRSMWFNDTSKYMKRTYNTI